MCIETVEYFFSVLLRRSIHIFKVNIDIEILYMKSLQFSTLTLLQIKGLYYITNVNSVILSPINYPLYSCDELDDLKIRNQ